MEEMFEFIFKITYRFASVKEWFMRNKPRWVWLNDWATECKFPINPMDTSNSIKVFKRRNNMQLHQNFLKSEFVKNLPVREARLKRLELLNKGEIPDMSNEIDMDLVDLQDYKFVPGEIIELYKRKVDRGA